MTDSAAAAGSNEHQDRAQLHFIKRLGSDGPLMARQLLVTNARNPAKVDVSDTLS